MTEDENSPDPVHVDKEAVVDEKTAVIISTPEADKINATQAANVKRLIESKSIKREEEVKALVATKSINEIDLNILLTKDDNLYYQEKKGNYLEAYPDLGDDPFDLDDLHLMIMEQVFQRNLLKKQKKRPSQTFSAEYEKSIKRHESFKKSLSVRRTDRKKDKGERKQIMNVASLSVNFSTPEKMDAFTKRLEDMREEEADTGLRIEDKVFE